MSDDKTLPFTSEAIQAAGYAAQQSVLWEHKLLGFPIAVSDPADRSKVLVLQPDQIDPDPRYDPRLIRHELNCSPDIKQPSS